MVREGFIKYYGISSNTLGYFPDEYDFINLNEVVECASRAAQVVNGSKENHHFQVIQMPANLIEHQLISVRNNQYENEWYSVLERANQLNLDVLLNRPLNASYKRGYFTNLLVKNSIQIGTTTKIYKIYLAQFQQ